jgi:hypothetical protein
MKKIFQTDISYKARSFILICLALFAANGVLGQRTTVLPNNSSYSNKTAPQGALRYQRGLYLITASEMNSSGLAPASNINAIGFTIGRASGDTAHGHFKVYLQNTTDLVSRADTGWQLFITTGNHYDANLLFPGDYEWQVKANCSTSSPFSPSVFFSNGDLTGCNNPYNLNTTSITTSAATLVWESATSPGFVNYQVEYTPADNINWISATTTDTFYHLSGLIPGKSYQWKVRTVCSATSSTVNLSSFTTNTVSNCDPPTGLSYAVRQDSIVKLTWTIPTGALYFHVQFRRAGTASWSTTSSFTDSAVLVLPTGTTYEWRIRTVCGADSTGNFVNGTNFSTGGTPVCYEPTNTVTRQISDVFAELSWTTVIGATDYTVRYRLKNTISWPNAIGGMQLACDSSIIIPDTTGAFDIPFHGGSAFNYTGDGLYIAWEFSRPGGTLTSPSVILSTTKGTSIQGANGQDSVRYLLCMISKADSGLNSLPGILGESSERPETRLGSGSLADSAAVVSVFALGKTAPKYQSPSPVSALIENKATTNKSFNVTLTVKEKLTGTVRYTATQTLAVTATDTALVSFTGWSPADFETDSIFISIPAQPGENVINNNSKAYVQEVNNSYIAYDDGTPMVGSAGFDSTPGLTLSKLHIDGCGLVISAKIYLTESATGHPFNAVIRNTAGTLVAVSPVFTPGADDVNRYHSFYFTTPASFHNQDFYIGLKQSVSTPGNFPVGVQWEDAETRKNAYYRADFDGTNLVDYPSQGRLMIIAEVVASATEPFIDGNHILCTTGSILLTAGSTNTRFANAVVGYSSQYENSNYSASQVLGTANVFPDYALSPKSWMSNTADGQREYLELSFPNAAPVNFVDIYETANAGAVDSVFVKNPGTLAFDLVYSTTAAPTAPVARKNRISFPLTAYNVSEIRIAINSPAVTGHNAIDAVSIGKKDLPGTFSTYLWTPGGETTPAKTVTAPGIYTLTVTNASGCQLKDSVNIVAAVTTPPVITGPSSFCQGDSIVLTSNQPTGNTWSPGGATTQSITVNTAGSYTVTYNDGSGCGSLTSAPFVVTVNPLPTVSITGTLDFCPGSSTVLDAGAGYTHYFWNTGDTTQTITVTLPGVYNATVTNSNGCRNTGSVTTSFASLAPPVITGNLSFCPGGSTVLDAGAGYSSYSWSTGATTRTITVTTADQYEVTVTNAGSCSAFNSVITSLFTPPSPQIAGNNGFCSGSSTTLTATTGYVSYLWSTGVSTQFIVVNTTGSYTVTVTDNNGCTGSISKNIVVFPAPAPVISGTLSFCGGTSTTLNAGPGYSSYLWSPGGATTQTINVNTVGTFTVTVTNANGCSASASAITTNTGSLPATPGPITGPAIGSCNTTGINYSISPVPNTSHYVWTVPSGASIASGQGTTSISVNFGPTFQGGNIVVAASNACGQSPSLIPRILYVQVLANMPGAIAGQSSGICGPTTKTYSIAAVPMAISYTWSVPAGANIVSGQGTTSVIVSFNAGFSYGNLCVTANNVCGSSVAKCILISGVPPTPGAISGLSVVCKNQSNLFYSVAAVPGATSYTWTVPQSANIPAGQGTNNIVVNMGPHSGNITVKANSACGSSNAQTLAITTIVCIAGPQNYTLSETRPVPEVISNYGGSASTGKLYVEWTLGEPRIEQVSKTGMLYTQGFHQPLVYTLSVSKPDTVLFDGIKVMAFPNPVSTILNVKIESTTANRPLLIELTDLFGNILQQKNIPLGTSDIIELQMGRYIAGAYFLVVRDMSGRIINTVKLEKLNYMIRY